MMNSRKTVYSGLVATALLLAAASCSNTRFLKEGQALYTDARVKVEGDSLNKKEKSELKAGLEENITPKPNSSFLGLRPKLYIYNITREPEKKKGLRYWLKYKVGEKPVLLGDVDREFNKKIIINYSENKGYFNAEASEEAHQKNQRAEVIYTVKPHERYIIGKVDFPADSSVINKEIRGIKDNTLLKTGNPFDLDVIKSERKRIDASLKNRGFYYFHPDNIIVQADSTVSNHHKVDLFVKLKNNTPAPAKEQFAINNVVVFPDYSIQDVRRGMYKIPVDQDSLPKYAYHDIYVIDPRKKFKPVIFDRALYFKKGDLYNRADHNLSLNRLINLGVFKFVKNDFIVSDSLQHKFDAYYILTPNELQSLRLEALGRTNSANYAGSELNLNWTHRNIFRGAEQLKASLYGAFDVQVGGAKDANNLFRAGTNVQLSVPRILAPFRFHSSSAYVPRTNMSIGYEFQSRTQYYTLNNFNFSFGYVWKENARKEHDLRVFDVTLVSPEKVTDRYRQLIDSVRNPALSRMVEKQLILGPTYTYTYTNTMLPKTNTVYYRGMVDLAGNLTGLLTGANVKDDRQKEIFNIPFSQYAKMEHDFRFYHKFNDKTSLATRFIAGIAYPYGNSQYVPFSRQFFSGGSNSIRAFRARTLGPGSFDPSAERDNLYFDESGDVKLEMNAEYRANLFKYVNVAAFLDAGNIWLINDDPSRPGGKFSKDFLSEIAVGGGVGLRLDFSIMILRLDLAMPLRIPYYEKGERWTFDKIDFGSKSWRRDNLILNIAIGYPF